MKHIFLFIVIFVLFSCNKEQEKINISDITNEDNYKISNTEENDTIIQISGENNQYKLKGYKDIKNNTRVGWWKIKDKNNNYLYEIEYISLDKNKENQIKFYRNNKLVNKFSKYYDVVYNNNGYQFKFYFPQYSNEKVRIEFGYMTKDDKVVEDKNVVCKKENDYYTCFIPVKNKDQLIAGIVTQFTESIKKNEKIVLSSTSMYVNTPR